MLDKQDHNICHLLKKQQYHHFSDFHYYPTVESTNKTAINLLQKNITDGTVIISKTQTQGRGRYHRTWYSPPGGLYLTFLFSTTILKSQIPLFPLLAAVSVNTLLRDYNIHSDIKWPNDILVNTKKIAGILLQSIHKHSKQYIICGIGINVNIKIDTFPSNLLNPATSMLHETRKNNDIIQLIVELIHSFENNYEILLNIGPKAILADWKTNSDTIGKTIQITNEKEIITGIAEDITEDGFLIIRKKNGTKEKILSGDCFYRM